MVDTFSWQTQASVAILRRVFVRGHAGLRQLRHGYVWHRAPSPNLAPAVLV